MAVSTDEIIKLATGGSDLPVPAEAKRIRRAAGVSQLELARTLGVHEQTVSGWETGEFEPAGENRARYRLFLQHAALTQRTRRREIMSDAFGLGAAPIDYSPPAIVCGMTEIHEADLTALLQTLKAAGEDGLTVTIAEKGIRRYGDRSVETHDRAVYLAHRGFVDRKPNEDWQNGELIRQTETFTLTPKGAAVIEEVSS